MNYYNENDPFAASWLRALIAESEIPKGEVDERSIIEVNPNELTRYTQCHFFAGIGGWPLALKLAGWPESRPVWTGSCPCQPFSVGTTDQAKGTGDHRDLWGDFFALIKVNKPPTVFGEQVKNAISWGWWDRAKMDCENEGYSVAAAVLRSDAFGAAHRRQRLYWMAHAGSAGWPGHQPFERVPVSTAETLPVNGDPLAGARRALAGDYRDLLPCNGVSVVMERSALKGYGNAIVPKTAAVFIQSAFEAIT